MYIPLLERIKSTKLGKKPSVCCFFAEIEEFEKELHSEMERVELFSELPEKWTYPLIQPLLIQEYHSRNNIKENFNGN